MTYEKLLREADSYNLITKEKNLPVSKGRIKGNKIAIRKDLTNLEKNVLWPKNSDTTILLSVIY